MPCLRLVLLLATMVTFSGCRRTADEMPIAPAASEQRFLELREQYRATDPQVLLGRVTDVRHLDRLVEVRDIETEWFRVGEVISFIDSDEQFLTHGTVVRKLPDALHVEYVEPAAAARAPQIGDIAIRFRR